MTDPTAGFLTHQGMTASESKRLADAGQSEPDRDTGENHSAHAAGQVCKNCGHAIGAEEPARLRGEDVWVHDVCPIVLD